MEFWNSTHPLNEDFDHYFNMLVPTSGNSEWVAGEVLRAATRIYYDHYNNGSCNNVTGAWNFLDTFLPGLMSAHGMGDRLAEVNAAMLTVAPYMNCNAPYVTFKETELNNAMDTIVEIAVLIAKAQDETYFRRNTTDIFEFQENDVYVEDEEEEYYY